ncbi:hypothetical protein HKD37_12G033074 [Glycine soja]
MSCVSTLLKGQALHWFDDLLSNSFKSFEALAIRSSIQFATSRPYHLTSVALLNIRQENREPLDAFM